MSRKCSSLFPKLGSHFWQGNAWSPFCWEGFFEDPSSLRCMFWWGDTFLLTVWKHTSKNLLFQHATPKAMSIRVPDTNCRKNCHQVAEKVPLDNRKNYRLEEIAQGLANFSFSCILTAGSSKTSCTSMAYFSAISVTGPQNITEKDSGKIVSFHQGERENSAF